MNQPFDTFNIHKNAKVYDTSHDTLNSVTDRQFLKSLCQTFFDRLFLRENQLVCTAIDVENRRISLSIKEFRPNEWEEFSREHQPGDVVDVEIEGIGTLSNPVVAYEA